jgi:carboxypeptidase family protein
MRFLMTFAGMLLAVAAPALESQQRGGVDPPSPLDRTVTLALERVPLKDALTELTRLTGVRIAYSRRVVPLDKPVSVQLDAVRVQAALDSLLHGTGVAPTVDRSGQILLVTESDPSHRRSRLQTGSIAGTVRSGATGTPLVSARVTVVGTRLSAETDAEGRYAITAVPAGSHRVRARMLGYAPADTTVAVREGEQSALDFQLRASAIELDPVVATGRWRR